MRGRSIRILLGIGFLTAAAGLCLTGTVSQAKKVKPKKITVAAKKKTLTVGDSYQITYTVKPKKAKNKKVSFSSSKKSVASVTKKGVVTAKNKGSAVLTLRAKAKKAVKAKVRITVKEKETAPLFSKGALIAFSPIAAVTAPSAIQTVEAPTAIIMQKTLELEPGERYQMTASLMPATATGTITYSCDFQGGINVYSNGSVYVTEDTPPGTTADIKASCGSIYAVCRLTVKYGACDHTWNAGSITTLPGCVTDGVKTYTCTKCGKTKTEEVPPTGHSWDAGRETRKPTCEAQGKMLYTCRACMATREEDTPAAGHVWENGTLIQEPTCTSKGKKQYTCSVCEAQKTETVAANGHSWDAGEVTTEPGCTTKGRITYHCTVDGCKGTKTEATEATGHTYNYGEITTPSTCTAGGTRTSECLICGKKMYVKLEPLGHDMDAGKITKEATCTGSGKKTYTCQRCGLEETEVLHALKHDWGDFVIDKPAGCTTKGKKSKYCKRCGKQGTSVGIAETGHDFDEGKVVREATCAGTGKIVYTCRTCQFEKKGAIKAKGHDWEQDFTVDEQPTCTGNGLRSIHCSRCKNVKNIESIKPLGHDYSVAEIKKPASCTEEGLMHYDCQRENCEHWKEEPIPATGHSYTEEYVTDEEPTCTLPGSKSKHCQTCGYLSDIQVIPAKGHQWGGWSDVEEATCTEGGKKKRTCGVCQTEEQSAVPAAGHTRDASGTCSKCGEQAEYKETIPSDWSYTLDGVNKIITLRYYQGQKEYITIPAVMDVAADGVKTSYTVAFKECEGRETTGVFTSNGKKCEVKGVRFGSGMKIDKIAYLFYGCKSLEEVSDIPDTVTDMCAAFKGCEKLVSISGGLPSGITELRNTFENCTSLQMAPEIPASVTSLYAAFKNASALQAAPEIPAGVTNMDWTFSGCKGLLMPPVLPDALTSLTNTFSDCTALQEVPAVIPAGVTRMTMTYYGCTSLVLAPEVPSTVEIMEYTYKNCTGLTYASPISSKVKQTDVFAGCSNLK